MERLNGDRKMDSTGRILIPKRIREKLNLKEGDNFQFYLLEEGQDKYLCIKCPSPSKEEIEKAKNLLKSLGINNF